MISYFRAIETWNLMTWDGLVQRTGKYCSIRPMEYQEFQTGIFGRMKSAHSSHVVVTPINRLPGVDSSWLRQKLGISVFVKTATVAKPLSWQQP